MSVSAPDHVAFDPEAPPPLSGGPGRVVLVLASAEASRARWAPGVAVGLARGWAARGHRVVLVDHGLSVPSLHAELGMANGEGLSDAVLYGASVGRVARGVEGLPLFVVPAGTAVADARAVPGHARWAGMRRGFVEAGATLVVFLPEGEALPVEVAGPAADVVVLAEEGEDPSGLLADFGAPARALLGPPAGWSAPVVEPDRPGGDALARDAPAADDPGGSDHAGTGAVSEDEPIELGDPVTDSAAAGPPVDVPSPVPDALGSGTTGEAGPLAAHDVVPGGGAVDRDDPPEDPDPLTTAGEDEPRVPTAEEILAEAGDTPLAAREVGARTGEDGGSAAARPRSRAPALLALLLVVLVAAAALWWLGWIEVPGLVRPGGAPG